MVKGNNMSFKNTIKKDVKKTFDTQQTKDKEERKEKKEIKKAGYKAAAFKKESGEKKPFNKSAKRPFNKSDTGPVNKSDKRPFNKSDKKPFNKFDKKPFNKFDKNKSNGFSGDKKGEDFTKRRREIDTDTLTLRRLYNKLMLKKDNNKPEIIEKILKLIKDNYKEHAFKHDGCRVLQGSIKYGSKVQKKLLINNLKDIIYELATKKYSIFLAMKIWKFSEKNEQMEIIKVLVSKFKVLVKSASGEMFLNYVFANSSNKMQDVLSNYYLKSLMKINLADVKELKEKFDEEKAEEKVEENTPSNKMEIDDEEPKKENIDTPIEDTNNILIQRSETFLTSKFSEEIKKTLEVILEKELHRNFIFHEALNKIFNFLNLETKTYISELFDDDFEVFINNKNSMELAVKLYTVASAKTKKKIMKKVFKDDWVPNFLSFDFNMILLSKILMNTDDTKITSKIILKPLMAYSDANDYTIFIRVLHGLISPTNKISPLLEYNLDCSSKKDLIKIQSELLSSCKEKIFSVVKVHTEKFMLGNKDMTTFLFDLIDLLFRIEATITSEKSNKKSIRKSSKASIHSVKSIHSEKSKKEEIEEEEETKGETEDDSKSKDLLKGVLDEVLPILSDFLTYDYNHNEDKFLFDKTGHSVIIKILKILFQEKKEEEFSFTKIFVDGLINLIKTHTEAFIKSKGVFIVLIIFENLNYKQELYPTLKLMENKIEEIVKENLQLKNSAASILLSKLK
jgi:hypothetical protein